MLGDFTSKPLLLEDLDLIFWFKWFKISIASVFFSDFANSWINFSLGSTSITGVTLYTMKKDLIGKEVDTVEFKNTLLSAELNSNLNRGYSINDSDSVTYGIGLTGATLTQRNVWCNFKILI